MKKNKYTKAILIIFLMSFLNCKSQIVVDITSDDPVPSNYKTTGQYYLKDVHNYLLPFIGTWEYINGNEKFQIILTKVTKYHIIAPYLNLNFYEDRIVLQYRKFVNGNLIFESPTTEMPIFTSENGVELKGALKDYGRVTQTVYKPQQMGGGVWKQGGEYFYPDCTIEQLPLSLNQPPKIKFHLYFWEHSQMFDSPYNNPLYNGLPTFSIPNDIVMTKVP